MVQVTISNFNFNELSKNFRFNMILTFSEKEVNYNIYICGMRITNVGTIYLPTAKTNKGFFRNIFIDKDLCVEIYNSVKKYLEERKIDVKLQSNVNIAMKGCLIDCFVEDTNFSDIKGDI